MEINRLNFLRGEVGAVVRRRKSDSREEFRARIHRDVWEAVLPELVYGPPLAPRE